MPINEFITPLSIVSLVVYVGVAIVAYKNPKLFGIIQLVLSVVGILMMVVIGVWNMSNAVASTATHNINGLTSELGGKVRFAISTHSFPWWCLPWIGFFLGYLGVLGEFSKWTSNKKNEQKVGD